MYTNLSETIINRLSIYMHYLTEQEEQGERLVSSYDIAQVCGVTAGLVRKDLARFGKFGIKGVGYDVIELCEGIKTILGLDHTLHVAILGMGTLGSYLLSLKDFLKGNYEIVATFDMKPTVATRTIAIETGSSVEVQHLSRLREVNERQRIDIALITTVPSEAQKATDQAVQSGIRGILNFTAAYVKAPWGFVVKNVQFTNVQDNLVYLLKSPQG